MPMSRQAKCCSTRRRCPTTAQLSKRNLDEQQAGARVAVDAHKKNPQDFVLWKLSSPEEPGWNSPWGRGRPGWHIECSAMSAAYLGEVFDIHGGGLDLIFPHHENEIAQSRCAHGTDVMANVWMHNGFLQVEGQKMSKSLGNFYSINELLETETFGGRKWPGEVLRLAMLMTHYREPIDFSVRKLEEAENTLRKWKRAADLAPAAAGQVPAEVIDALSDDLATYAAFQILTQLAGEAADGNEAAAAAEGIAVVPRLRCRVGRRRRRWCCQGDRQSPRPHRREELGRGRPHPRRPFGTRYTVEGRQGPRHRRTHHHLGGQEVRVALDTKWAKALVTANLPPCGGDVRQDRGGWEGSPTSQSIPIDKQLRTSPQLADRPEGQHPPLSCRTSPPQGGRLAVIYDFANLKNEGA